MDIYVNIYIGFPDSSVDKESACNARDPVWLLGWEDPLEKGKATHSSVLSRRIPWTVAQGVAESQTQLSNFHVCVFVCVHDSFCHDHAVLCD